MYLEPSKIIAFPILSNHWALALAISVATLTLASLGSPHRLGGETVAQTAQAAEELGR